MVILWENIVFYGSNRTTCYDDATCFVWLKYLCGRMVLDFGSTSITLSPNAVYKPWTEEKITQLLESLVSSLDQHRDSISATFKSTVTASTVCNSTWPAKDHFIVSIRRKTYIPGQCRSQPCGLKQFSQSYAAAVVGRKWKY